MAGRIPQTFIDDLLDRVDIVDVINGRVQLKKAGKNYKACCPFHEEKSPSFTVAQDKQFYYCFGCGAGGNALGFVMEFDRLDFLPAVEMLARNAGLEIPREATRRSDQQTKRQPLLDTCRNPIAIFASNCASIRPPPAPSTTSKAADSADRSQRSIGVGYAPPGWDNLLKAVGTDANSALGCLTESGMLVSKPEEKKQYDAFATASPSRSATSAAAPSALADVFWTTAHRNISTHQRHPVFPKGRELYGLYEARQELKEIPCLIMVEGYMDVIALAQFDINNAVATLGTALTESHLQKIFRYTSEIVFCFDGDNAGRKAAARALDTATPGNA